METSYVAERCGKFCQIYHTGLKKVVRRVPYSEQNFSTIIRTARRLGFEEWEKLTGRKLSDNKELSTATNETILDEGVTTMEYELPTVKEIESKAMNANALSITFKPTERTFIHMMFPRPEVKAKTSTGKTIVFAGQNNYHIQLTEEKKDGDVRLINNDTYGNVSDAADAFYKQIDFCMKMYGRVQPVVCKWQ